MNDTGGSRQYIELLITYVIPYSPELHHLSYAEKRLILGM